MAAILLVIAFLIVGATGNTRGDVEAHDAAPRSTLRQPATCPRTGVEQPGDRIGRDGIVYRRYGGYGHRFQPLSSFARLDGFVNARSARCTRRLAAALLRRGVARGGALYWEYDFPYGGPVPWTSGFVQAVAAQALARAGALVGDSTLVEGAHSSFAGLRRTLLMPLGGGLWVREYSFTDQAILNAQLESVLSVESYAAAGRAAGAVRMADSMRRAARNLLPRFDLGCWARYELGGAAASEHYQRYHVELLRRLAASHPDEPIWRETYLDWRRCVHG